MSKKKEQEKIARDVSIIALVNKAIELTSIQLNITKDARYKNLGTLLYNVNQDLQDKMREEYIDDPIPDADVNKYQSATSNKKAKAAQAAAQANIPSNDDDDTEDDDEEDDDEEEDDWYDDSDEDDDGNNNSFDYDAYVSGIEAGNDIESMGV